MLQHKWFAVRFNGNLAKQFVGGIEKHAESRKQLKEIKSFEDLNPDVTGSQDKQLVFCTNR